MKNWNILKILVEIRIYLRKTWILQKKLKNKYLLLKRLTFGHYFTKTSKKCKNGGKKSKNQIFRPKTRQTQDYFLTWIQTDSGIFEMPLSRSTRIRCQICPWTGGVFFFISLLTIQHQIYKFSYYYYGSLTIFLCSMSFDTKKTLDLL